jgi:hypothetical protein
MGPGQRVKPWMVAVALALAGIAGAAVVLTAARAQHARDRGDIAAFRRAGLAVAEGAYTDHRALRDIAAAMRSYGPGAAPASTLTERRARLEAARHTLSDSKIAIPDILARTYAAYLEGIAGSLRALSTLQDAVGARAFSAAARAGFDREWSAATARFEAARAAFHTLECSARLPDCGTK